MCLLSMSQCMDSIIPTHNCTTRIEGVRNLYTTVPENACSFPRCSRDFPDPWKLRAFSDSVQVVHSLVLSVVYILILYYSISFSGIIRHKMTGFAQARHTMLAFRLVI